MDDIEEILDSLLAALPALDAGQHPSSGTAFRRVEMDFGATTGWFESPFGGETDGFPAGKGPRPVYLVLDGDEVRAVLVQYGDTRPVEAIWEGDRLMTVSGLLVLHGRDIYAGTDIALQMATRVHAALRLRTLGEGDWDRAAALAADLAEAGRDPEGSTVTTTPGDLDEGWLLVDDPAGPALGCLIDPDGYSLVTCLDTDGNETAALLFR